MSTTFGRLIGFADSYGTRARVDYDPPEDSDGAGMIGVTIECGACTGRGYPTAEAARQMAAALLDAADRLDAEATVA